MVTCIDNGALRSQCGWELCGDLNIVAPVQQRKRGPAANGVCGNQCLRNEHRFHACQQLELADGAEEDANEGIGAYPAVLHDSQDLLPAPTASKAVKTIAKAVLMEAASEPNAGQGGQGCRQLRAP